MQREGISYGRYNDDIRIFGNKKSEVLEALKIIQEEVLTLGLNLNSTKTKLHEGPEQIRKVSNPSYGEEYGDESEEEEVLSTQTEELKKFVDTNGSAIARDHDDDPVFLARNAWHLQDAQDKNPDIQFKAIK